MKRISGNLENTLHEDDYYVTCYIEDRIITLKELQNLQNQLNKIKGYYFEIHGAITSK